MFAAPIDLVSELRPTEERHVEELAAHLDRHR